MLVQAGEEKLSAEISDDSQTLQIDEAIHGATAALLGANRAIRDRDQIIATEKAKNAALEAENAHLRSQLQEFKAVQLLSNFQHRACKTDVADAGNAKADVPAAAAASAAAAGGSSYVAAAAGDVITQYGSSTVKTESADSPHRVPEAASANAPQHSPVASNNLDQLLAAAAANSPSDLMAVGGIKPLQR